MWDVCCLNLASDTTELLVCTALEECAAGEYNLKWGKCKGVTLLQVQQEDTVES